MDRKKTLRWNYWTLCFLWDIIQTLIKRNFFLGHPVFTRQKGTQVFNCHQVAEVFTSHQVTLVFTNSRKYSSATGYTAAVVAGNKNKQREPPVFLGASESISEWLTRLCPRELFTREGHSPLTIGVWNNLYQSSKKWKFCNQYFGKSWFDRKFLPI